MDAVVAVGGRERSSVYYYRVLFKRVWIVEVLGIRSLFRGKGFVLFWFSWKNWGTII